MQNAPQRMNMLATRTTTRAKSVQARSRDVLREVTMDIKATRDSVIAMRVKHGADTPIGRRCSNIGEIIDRLETATGDERTRLLASLQEQMDDLTRLTKGT